jgi:hypothetical protein
VSTERTTTKPVGPRPTDEELMLFADGELEGARRDEVADHVAADPIARRKVAALRFAGDLVCETALEGASPADGIADAVMAQIARDAEATPDAKAEARSFGSEASSSSKIAKIGEVTSLEAARVRRAEAGRSRRIFALAAVAAAAAAAMLLWGRTTPEHPVATRVAPEVPTESAAPLPSETAKPAPAAEQGGAEVAAVDFGARTGSIFYVPSDAASKMTAVVWIDDDTAGGL